MRQRILLILLATILAACGAPPTPTRRPVSSPTPTITLPTPTPLPADTPPWFRSAIVYQISTRSFYDSNGDGVGDLAGITQKLDHVQSLGANVVWISPVFSTADASGHNVIDHFTIAPELGTQQDLAALVDEAHARGLRVIIDLLAGRTSKDHPFFQDAFRKPDSFYSDWYLWENTAQSAYQAASNDKSDPLLNMANPLVERYLLEVARYWMDLDNDGDLTDGVDGFFDYASFSPSEFWQTLRDEVKNINPNFVLLGYIQQTDPGQLTPYYSNQFDALLDAPMYFTLLGNWEKTGEGLLNGRGAPTQIATQLNLETELFPPYAQLVRFIGNHDTNRALSKLRNNLPRARQAALLLLTLPGTPMIYYGEEIGLQGDRSAARASMDWAAVQAQTAQPESLLEMYRAMGNKRRATPALDVGGFQLTETDGCSACLAYWRWDANDIYLMLFNLSNEAQTTSIDFIAVPRHISGAGEDVLRSGSITVPSNGRYTLTIEENGIRVFRWGKP